MTVAMGVCAAVLSGVFAVFAVRWLDSRAYRYDDEADIRLRSHQWVIVVLPIAVTAVTVAQAKAAGITAGLVVGALAAVLVVVAAIDLDVRRLPDTFTLKLIPATAVGLAAVAAVSAEWSHWVRALTAGIVLGAIYFLLALVGGATGMGLGDVKLAPTLGMLLGWHSWTHVFVGTMLAFAFGGLVGLGLIVFAGRDRKSTLPFGPIMAASCLALLALPAVTS